MVNGIFVLFFINLNMENDLFSQADPKERKKHALSFTYEGDPDLTPIRSWENKFLVRVLYYICLWINTQVFIKLFDFVEFFVTILNNFLSVSS